MVTSSGCVVAGELQAFCCHGLFSVDQSDRMCSLGTVLGPAKVTAQQLAVKASRLVSQGSVSTSSSMTIAQHSTSSRRSQIQHSSAPVLEGTILVLSNRSASDACNLARKDAVFATSTIRQGPACCNQATSMLLRSRLQQRHLHVA